MNGGTPRERVEAGLAARGPRKNAFLITEGDAAQQGLNGTADPAATFNVYEAQAPLPPWGDGPHPLDHYVSHSEHVAPVEFVIDDVLIFGTAIVAGPPGIGKTEGLVSLTRYAAWLCSADDPIRPLLRRHIVYVTEDPAQVDRILHAVRLQLEGEGVQITKADIDEWFHVVPAARLQVEDVVKVAPTWVDKFTTRVNRRIDGAVYPVVPLVVLDTKSATIALEDENSNAEHSRVISVLRTGMEGLPVLIVAHLAKDTNRKSFDPFELTPRGAGSQHGDVQQALAFVLDPDKRDTGARFLVLGKRRFETSIKELEFTRHRFTVEGQDVLGNAKRISIACSTVTTNEERTLGCKADLVRQPSFDGQVEQVLNLLRSQFERGQYLSGHALEVLAVNLQPAPVSRAVCRDAISNLKETGRIEERPLPPEKRKSGERGGQSKYLHPIARSGIGSPK